MTDVALRLRNVKKYFGASRAVHDVSLDVVRGEFVTLLGPSGSGKTTTLRMIAGFITQSSGEIEIDARSVANVPPYRRDVGMVFQNYALFPHMTAAENIAFPLKMRRVDKRETVRRVGEALDLVALGGYGERYPRQLSGGQQQRVALARAVVSRPKLLLMDEPLGALDKKLRETLQLEILRVSRQINATTIYVTHDQEEALALSDRIAVFSNGQIEQLGTGEDLYERPSSLFVADFIGESNILRGAVRTGQAPEEAYIDGAAEWRIRRAGLALHGLSDGSRAAIIVRPERLHVVEDGRQTDNVLDATVNEALYLGPTWRVQLRLASGDAAVLRTPRWPSSVRAGDAVRVGWNVDDAVVVPASDQPATAAFSGVAHASDDPATVRAAATRT